jgi:hypothetical protein
MNNIRNALGAPRLDILGWGMPLLAAGTLSTASQSTQAAEFHPVTTRATAADRVADRPNYAHSLQPTTGRRSIP